MDNTVLILAIIVLVAHSAFFSSSEIGYAKSNKLRIKKSAESGKRTGIIADYINEHYTRSLSTVLVGNNLVNIGASSVSALLAANLLSGTRWEQYDEVAATVSMTVILLIFGETVPKIIASSIPDKIARLYAFPMKFYMTLFRPIVFVVDKIVGLFRPIWTPKETQPQVTAEELCELLETIEDEGVFTEEEGELIKSAIEFTDTTAHEILTPRVDIVALDIDAPLDFTDELFKHSRVPVYRDSLDNILGVLPTKKLMKEIIGGKQFDIQELLVEPLYVHKTKTVSSIINEFRTKHRQMAVVVDEFGGTMGILTMEDIMEEIVGDIFDERDEVEDEIVCVEENCFEVDGSTNIYDLFNMLEYEPDDFSSEYTTVGGWATEILDKFPEAGDEFTYERLTVTVLEAEAMRVNKLRVVLAPDEDEVEDDKG